MLVNVTNGIMGRGGGGSHLTGGDSRNQPPHQKITNGNSSQMAINNNHNKSTPSFMRGDKASASVRIRSKKHEALLNGGPQPGQNICKKRNRHSGDFSFFSHNSSSKNVNIVASKLSSTNLGDVIDGDRSSSEPESQGAKDGGGDWAYITFPNGVPTVREIKTNGGATGGAGTPTVMEHPDVTNVANGACKSQPIKVVTRNVPGISMPFNNCQQDLSPSSPSSRYTDIREVQNTFADKKEPPVSVSTKSKANTPPSLSTTQGNNASILDPFSRQFRCMNAQTKRMSADFSQFGRAIFNGNGNINPYIQSPSREQSPFRIQQPGRVVNENGVVLRNKPKNFNGPFIFHNNVRHSRIVEEQITGGQLRNQPPQYQPPPPQYVTKVTLGQPSNDSTQSCSVTTTSQSTQMQRPNVLFRRKSEQQAPAGTAALLAGAAKRCSGEFDFARNNRRNGGPDFTHYGFINSNPLFRETSVSQPVTPSEPPSVSTNGFSSMIYQPVPELQEYPPVRVQVRSDSSPPLIRSENNGGTSTFGSSKSSRSSSSHTVGTGTPSSRRRSSALSHQHQISPLAAPVSSSENNSEYVAEVNYEEHTNSEKASTKSSQIQQKQQNYEVVNIDINPSSTKDSKSIVSSAVTPVKFRHPRQTGLGRRAITQIHIQQKKKDSYNSAVCKSQENLVKASLVSDEFEHVGASPGENSTNPALDSSFSTNGGFEEFENLNGGSSAANGSSLHNTSLEIGGELSSAANSSGVRSSSTVRKGLLWQQRDKIFSQWKERYFILTPDYLQCFKKGSSRITEMGEFIFKIKLSEVEDVDILDKRGYLVVAITPSGREGKIYLRKTEGIRDWYQCLKDCSRDSKKRRTDRTSGVCAANGVSGANGAFWKNKQITDSSSIENWLRARKKIGLQYAYLDPSSKDSTAGDILLDAPIGTSRSQDDDSAVAASTGNSGSKGIISGIRSGLSASSKKSARSEITLDELSDLYRSEAEEELREQEVAERRERLAVAAAANKRLFENDGSQDTVTINCNGMERSSGKVVQSKTPHNLQQSTSTVKTDTASTSSSIQMKIGSKDDLRLRKPSGNNKKINRLSLMSDIELPDYGVQTDLPLDIEKGIFLRKKNSDIESTDSGNNSMNTNGSVGSSNSSHSNSRGKEDRLETHVESEIPGEEEDNEQEKHIPDSESRSSTKIIVSNDHHAVKNSNIKQIQPKKEGQNSSSSASPSKTTSKALTPAGKIRERSSDIASGSTSKNSSPRHSHGRRGSAEDQRRAGAIASLAGISNHNGSPVIRKSLHQSPTESNPRQRRAKSSQPSLVTSQQQTQNSRRSHMPAGLQVTHV